MFIGRKALVANDTYELSYDTRSVGIFHDSGHLIGHEDQSFVPFSLTVHHPQKKSFDTIYSDLQLITLNLFLACVKINGNVTTTYKKVMLPDGRIAYRPIDRLSISPGEWDSIDFPLCFEREIDVASQLHRFELHILTSGPPSIVPFFLKITNRYTQGTISRDQI